METLKLDIEQTSTLDPVWNFGVNTCHAKLWERPDFFAHQQMARRDMGFRYTRCHGILNDDMGVVREDGSFSFDGPFRMIDAVLEAGYFPFLELTSMPTRIASGNDSVCFYKFMSKPPKDWRVWSRLIHDLVAAFTERYGKENLKNWYFEVWNEPDTDFWHGTREEYFKMYDLTRRVIKSICRDYRVGGPATSKTAWIPEFCKHVSQPTADDPEEGIRCDFVSTHAYPSDAAFFDGDYGEVKLEDASVIRHMFARARKTVDTLLSPEIPLIYGEWNSSAGPLTFTHDDSNNGAFVCKIVSELAPYCAGTMFWASSDIYEECGFHHQPFHGGYGLITVNGLYKAAGNAFRLLNKLAGKRIAVAFEEPQEEFGAIAALEEKTLRLLVWNYRRPEEEGKTLRLEIAGLPEYRKSTLEKVFPGAGSAFECWQTLGSPEYPDLETLQKLTEASEIKVLPDPQFPQELPSGSVALFSFELK